MSTLELALIGLMAGMAFTTVIMLLSMLVDLVRGVRASLRRIGHPVCRVCGDVAAPGDDDYCWRHMHLRTLKQAERTMAPEPRSNR